MGNFSLGCCLLAKLPFPQSLLDDVLSQPVLDSLDLKRRGKLWEEWIRQHFTSIYKLTIMKCANKPNAFGSESKRENIIEKDRGLPANLHCECKKPSVWKGF